MKIFSLILCICFFINLNEAMAQTYGCTDPQAVNYNAAATANDGSCTYNPVTVSPASGYDLAGVLEETSGLAIWNGRIITINDNNDSTVYAIDTLNGNIVETYPADGAINTDWEEISQDENYIYIGDFGNNVHGNRTDLHILRISKISLLNHTPDIDTIAFSYSNQGSFGDAGENNTDFDCEAFFITTDSIFLLSKQWIGHQTSLYALPKMPGNYVADLRGSLNVNGLITGAVYLSPQRLLALSGYSTLLQPFIYLLYDFSGTDFFGANKRKVTLDLPFHQTEGITSVNGLKYYITNERLLQPPLFDVKQKLHILDLNSLLQQYIQNALSLPDVGVREMFSIFPNPAVDAITIHAGQKHLSIPYSITDQSGRVLLQGKLVKTKTVIYLDQVPAGMLFLNVGKKQAQHFKIIRK